MPRPLYPWTDNHCRRTCQHQPRWTKAGARRARAESDLCASLASRLRAAFAQTARRADLLLVRSHREIAAYGGEISGKAVMHHVRRHPEILSADIDLQHLVRRAAGDRRAGRKLRGVERLHAFAARGV